SSLYAPIKGCFRLYKLQPWVGSSTARLLRTLSGTTSIASFAESIACVPRAIADIAIVICMVLTPMAMKAQNSSGTVQGLVLDPAADAVAGAALVLRNTATGQLRHTQTDQQGAYSFPLLPPGTYRLDTTARGFSTHIAHDLVLQVGESMTLDIRLQLARAQTSLRVESRPRLLETASPAIGEEIDNRRVRQLPLNGRQFSQLALLA